MYKLCTIILIFLLLSYSENAAQFSEFKINPFSNTLHLTIGGGLNRSETDYTNPNIGLSGFASADYYFQTSSKIFFGLKLNANIAVLSGDRKFNSSINKFDKNIISVGPGVTLNYQLNKLIYPFIEISGKQVWFDNSTANAIVGGFGVKYLVSQYLAINANIEFNFINDDNIDGMIINGSQNDYYTTFSIGLSYAVDFTVSDDFDEDGILNNIDKCPQLSEDFDGFEDGDGCPEVDNDNDGIIDSEDKCINDSEDFDGFEDGDGCPELDNDGDGILDVNDKCPDIKEDFDGFEDGDGCPELDNDGDGILDINDKCLNEPETFNNFEDFDGCPDSVLVSDIIEEKIIEDVQNSKDDVRVKVSKISNSNEYILSADNTFSSNSSTLRKKVFNKLNLISKNIKNNPGYKWRIEGHLDNSGTPFEQKALSTARANAIMDYFISKGLPKNIFHVIGFGAHHPLMPNDTVEGKLKNRRIVIKRFR